MALPDGRLAGIVVEASPDTRQLFTVPLADVFRHEPGIPKRMTNSPARWQSKYGTHPGTAPNYRSKPSTSPGRPRRIDEQPSLAVFGVKPAATEEYGGFLPTFLATPIPRRNPQRKANHLKVCGRSFARWNPRPVILPVATQLALSC